MLLSPDWASEPIVEYVGLVGFALVVSLFCFGLLVGFVLDMVILYYRLAKKLLCSIGWPQTHSIPLSQLPRCCSASSCFRRPPLFPQFLYLRDMDKLIFPKCFWWTHYSVRLACSWAKDNFFIFQKCEKEHVYLHKPLILALGSQRKGNLYEYNTSIICRVSFRTVRAAWVGHCLKSKTRKE